MKKYKDYFYTTKKNNNNSYSWYIWSAILESGKREVLQVSEEESGTKTEAEIECEENIDEYYR